MPAFFESIAKVGVVPVVAIEKVEHALPLADALLEGGLPVVEVTFRTDAAADVIKLLAKERPRLIVGAGTVLSEETLKIAASCGARFAVAPGLNPSVVHAAQEMELPFIPGIATPSEIERGMDLGCKLLKFFPAEAMGGVKLLKAFSGPYKHTGVHFMPTGGVTAENLADYMKLPVVAAVGGTWIAKSADLAAGKWTEIAQRCKAAVALVKVARGESK